ncbi:MAG: BON domain-containing protein, partial [Caldilineaceae bacterium]|nr:BON domain-containing protein [Caldilineaceae bacterium]
MFAAVFLMAANCAIRPQWHWRGLLLALLVCLAAGAPAPDALGAAADAVIPLQSTEDTDRQIEQRIEDVFSQIAQFEALRVAVHAGVAALSGEAANEAQAQRALQLAGRVEGVITVEDDITRTLDLQDNLNPLVDSLRDTLRGWLRALP